MMQRDVEQASARPYDVAVVGGGVYGACVALEAARRGLSVVLVERDDFGQHCSANSLRILHGGLRYLQSMDLPRFRESVAERRWFMRHFPECTAPLRCVMPLYGKGLKRASTFRVALAMNDALSAKRNAGVAEANRLPRGRVLSRAETVAAVPGVVAEGLQGAGEWWDGQMTNAPRLQMELLRWAASCGAVVLNYAEAVGVVGDASGSGRVGGVMVRDRVGGETHAIEAGCVVSCAGQWAGRFGMANGEQGRVTSEGRLALAFNVLLDVGWDGPAVAVSPGRGSGRMYFVTPWHGKAFVGTMHVPWAGGVDGLPEPSEAQLGLFLDELDQSLPGLGGGSSVTTADVARVWPGLIPARPGKKGDEGETAHRAVLREERAGLWTLQGVKYTTARLEAERALRRAVPGLKDYQAGSDRPASLDGPWDEVPGDEAAVRAAVRTLVAEESARTAEDVLVRRTDWGVMPDKAAAVGPVVAAALGVEGDGRMHDGELGIEG